MGYFGLSGNLVLALGPALGLTLADFISFTQLFFICAALGLTALVLALNIKYQKVDESPNKTKPARFDVVERTAVNPSILLFFITLTFGGITSFLPLYAGKIYDKKGDMYVIPPGTILIFIAMLLLSWLPNMPMMLVAGALYGLGFGSVQPALQAWAVDKAPKNRKGMANATFFSFFDLGVGVGAILFGQLA